MKLETLPKEFLRGNKILAEINQNGFEAYFVGGSVRDVLLNQPIHDVDIATSAYPEEIKRIFHRTVDVGIEHGTVLVLYEDEQYEITTFRTESTYQDFRRPDRVTFVRSLKEDLQRRDFTINAFAMNESGEIIDLFDGISDMKKKLIRAVGNAQERFHEDALRMMRGLRFASQLDFSIEKETLSAIETWHALLEKISVERITIEFTKMLLGKNRLAGLTPFIETGTYQFCPDLANYKQELIQFSQLPNQQISTEQQAWALFIHTLQLKADAKQTFLKKWKLSNKLIQEVIKLSEGLTVRLSGDWQAMDIYKIGVNAALLVEELLVYFDKVPNLRNVQELNESLPIQEKSELEVSGNDLLQFFDKQPGKWLGQLILTLEEAVIDQRVENKKSALLNYAKEQIIND